MTTYAKPEAHNVIAWSSDEDRAAATGNMYVKFREVWEVVFETMRVDRQTYRQADRNTLRPCWAEVNTSTLGTTHLPVKRVRQTDQLPQSRMHRCRVAEVLATGACLVIGRTVEGERIN